MRRSAQDVRRRDRRTKGIGLTFLLGHGRANQSQKLAELEAELTALKFRVADLERRMHVSPELIAEIEEGARESKAWRKEREHSHRDSETPSTTASTYDPLAVTYDPPSFTYDPPATLTNAIDDRSWRGGENWRRRRS